MLGLTKREKTGTHLVVLPATSSLTGDGPLMICGGRRGGALRGSVKAKAQLFKHSAFTAQSKSQPRRIILVSWRGPIIFVQNQKILTLLGLRDQNHQKHFDAKRGDIWCSDVEANFSGATGPVSLKKNFHR